MLQEEKQREIVKLYGASNQIVCAIEEMAELTQALTKHLRGIGDRENIIEEIADVEVTLSQLKIIFDINQMTIDYKAIGKIDRALNGKSKRLTPEELSEIVEETMGEN